MTLTLQECLQLSLSTIFPPSARAVPCRMWIVLKGCLFSACLSDHGVHFVGKPGQPPPEFDASHELRTHSKWVPEALFLSALMHGIIFETGCEPTLNHRWYMRTDSKDCLNASQRSSCAQELQVQRSSSFLLAETHLLLLLAFFHWPFSVRAAPI